MDLPGACGPAESSTISISSGGSSSSCSSTTAKVSKPASAYTSASSSLENASRTSEASSSKCARITWKDLKHPCASTPAGSKLNNRRTTTIESGFRDPSVASKGSDFTRTPISAGPSLNGTSTPTDESSSNRSGTSGKDSKSIGTPTSTRSGGAVEEKPLPYYKKTIEFLTPCTKECETGEEHSTAVTDGGKVMPDLTGTHRFAICLAMCSVISLYGLDTTMSATIQVPISESFDSATKIGWVGIGFTLGSIVAILPLAKAYTLFDNKWVYICSLTAFTAGSALCGGAPSMNGLIIGRIVAGAGGAGVYQGSRRLVNLLITLKQQPLFAGSLALAYGAGCILGPGLGGGFSDSAVTWRWAFYLNVIICVVVGLVNMLLIPTLPREDVAPLLQRIKALNWLGTVLMAGQYTSFTLAFSFGGSIWAWNDSRIIALILVFITLTVLFVATQRSLTLTDETNRLFPCGMIGNIQVLLLYICVACSWAALFVCLYYIPLFFLFVRGDSNMEAAIHLMPFVCFCVVAVLLCGGLLAKTGYYREWYIVSGALLTIGGVLMRSVRSDTPLARIYGYTIILGLGMMTIQAGYVIGPLLTKPDQRHDAVRFLNVAQGQGMLMGLTIASSVFQSVAFSRLKEALVGTDFSDAGIHAAVAGVRSTALEQLHPDLRARCVDAVIKSINDVWVLVIVAGSVSVLCSCFLSRERYPGIRS